MSTKCTWIKEMIGSGSDERCGYYLLIIVSVMIGRGKCTLSACVDAMGDVDATPVAMQVATDVFNFYIMPSLNVSAIMSSSMFSREKSVEFNT